GDEQIDKIDKSRKNFRDSIMGALKSALLSSLTLEYISMLSIGIIALQDGLRLIVVDTISFFSAFLIMILVADIFTMLKDLGTAIHTARGSVSASQLLNEEFSKERKPVEWGSHELKKEKVPHISLQNINFSYNREFALNNISIEAKPYSQIAIIGKSGS